MKNMMRMEVSEYDRVLILNDGVKAFLELMNFGTIPKKAKYLAISNDGTIQYFEKIEASQMVFPKMKILSYSYYEGDIRITEA